jgi:hypothetical protein
MNIEIPPSTISAPIAIRSALLPLRPLDPDGLVVTGATVWAGGLAVLTWGLGKPDRGFPAPEGFAEAPAGVTAEGGAAELAGEPDAPAEPACVPGEAAVAVCEDLPADPFASTTGGAAASPIVSATANARAR